MSKPIFFITDNHNKVEMIRGIIGLDVTARNLEIPEIQSLDIEEVAKAKALSAFQIIGSPVIVDDTGMNIEALNGLPGALVTWFLDSLKPEGIIELLAGANNRNATVSTCIAYADETGVHTFSGTISGQIPDSPRGTNGFGYDPIFIPDGHVRTFAEMDAEEKIGISMRNIALLKFKKFCQNNISIELNPFYPFKEKPLVDMRKYYKIAQEITLNMVREEIKKKEKLKRLENLKIIK